MKLIFCRTCGTFTGLAREVRSCLCGASQGVYLDDRRAIYAGPCVPVGIGNGSFANAVEGAPAGMNEFLGFIIPRDSPWFRNVGVEPRPMSPYEFYADPANRVPVGPPVRRSGRRRSE